MYNQSTIERAIRDEGDKEWCVPINGSTLGCYPILERFLCKAKDSDGTLVNVRESFLVHLMIDLKHGSGTVVVVLSKCTSSYPSKHNMRSRGYIVYVNQVANLSKKPQEGGNEQRVREKLRDERWSQVNQALLRKNEQSVLSYRFVDQKCNRCRKLSTQRLSNG